MSPSMPADKGLYGGACNRSACLARPATWFNTSTRAHYCPPCGALINAWAVPRGTLVCSPVTEEQSLAVGKLIGFPPSQSEKPE